MEIVVPICCGLDVHKVSVAACLRSLGADGRVRKECRRFGTMTADLCARRHHPVQEGEERGRGRPEGPQLLRDLPGSLQPAQAGGERVLVHG